MKQQRVDYRVTSNPKLRRFEAAAFRPAGRNPMMHGLLEVDVSRARAFLREHKAKTGESISFTAFIIACLAQAIDKQKAVQAFRQGSKRIILFEDVDVYTLIDRAVACQEQPIPYIIRAANRKTVRAIHREIRAAQLQEVDKDMQWLQFLPDFLFRPFFWVFYWMGRRYPQLWKQYVGTVGVTAVGMFGKGAGWGIPPAMPTLMITVGGIDEKPVLVDGHIAMHDTLSLTISFNHDIVDGAPAARFTQRLKELIESGYGLLDSMGESVEAETLKT